MGFRFVTESESGVLFTNSLPDTRSITNRILLSGAGVAAGDVNADGWCDLYFCNLTGANQLFLGQGGFHFIKANDSQAPALANTTSTGAVFADIDGDGDLDLLVSSMGEGVRLFKNDGAGRFVDATISAGLSKRAGSMSMSLADIDGDGDLDLYVANFRESTLRDQLDTRFKLRSENGQPILDSVNGLPASHATMTNRFLVTSSGSVLERGEPDFLFINDGSGRFSPASFTDGRFSDEEGHPLTDPPRDWGLAVRFQDMNGDGAPDLYVCNDLFTPDRIWMNDGRGNFRALSLNNLRHTSTSSMGVDFADIDRDGRFDCFVTDMLSPHGWRRQLHGDDSMRPTSSGERGLRPQLSRNTLFRAIDDGKYSEIAYQAGVEASEWSWGPVFLDVDFDGFEDLIIPAGQRHDFQNAMVAQAMQEAQSQPGFNHSKMLDVLGKFPPLAVPVSAFRNRGDLTFELMSVAWGFTNIGIHQGMALADLDGDGDMELIINRLNAPPAIYENLGSAPRVEVVLKGSGLNTSGVGALIKVTDKSGRTQMQEMISGGRYLSSDQPIRSFAAPAPLDIKVTWRSGAVSLLENIPPDSRIRVNESSAHPDPLRKADSPDPLFVEASLPGGSPVNQEHPFDDLDRQPGMPCSRNHRGTGVSWLDLDGTGNDRLLVGGRRGTTLRGWKFSGGVTTAITNGILQKPLSRDSGTILEAGGALVVASSNYRDGSTNGGWIRVVALDRDAAGESILGPRSSAGVMVQGDIDGDGDLDLFVGGFSRPGRYPEPADSLLARNDSGRFIPMNLLERIGLVTGAVMCDLDGDGRPELILSAEWGHVHVISFKTGIPKDISQELGLVEETGLWQGLAAGDFDEDGRIDFVVANRGRNSSWKAARESPLLADSLDLSGERGLVTILSAGEMITSMTKLVDFFPNLRERYPTPDALARSRVEEWLPAHSNRHTVHTLDTTVFLNRGDHFELVRLPRVAQSAPAYGPVAADWNGDGHIDIFLTQNSVEWKPQINVLDDGRGMVLLGDGKGGFHALAPSQSGFDLEGQQRGAAVGDFNHDGRPDLAVVSSDGLVKIFENKSHPLRTRIRLEGNPLNRLAIGAVVRVFRSGIGGPALPVVAGSGWLSCDTAVQMVPQLNPGDQVKVFWPGGRETVQTISGPSVEVVLRENP